MQHIDTSFMESRLRIMDTAMEQMQDSTLGESICGLVQDVCTMEFERVLEQSGKLLRKRLAEYFASNRKADALTFRDCFRHAAKHGIIDCAACERWLQYRDNIPHPTQSTALSDKTLRLLAQFSTDAHALAAIIKAANND